MSNQDPEYIGQKSLRILRELDRRAENSRALGLGFEKAAGGKGEPLILTETGGRPYFADHHADFNISHSKRMAAVSYLSSPNRRFRTGCDIQYQQPKKTYREIAAHFFHPPEREFLTAARTGTEGLRSFYLLWTLKEAYLKIRGLSVFDLRRCPVFSFDGQTGGKIPSEVFRDHGEPEGEYFFSGDSGNDRNLEFFLYETRDPARGAYSLAVCREQDEPGPSAEPEVRWFSREKLPLKSIAKIKAAERPIKTVNPKI